MGHIEPQHVEWMLKVSAPQVAGMLYQESVDSVLLTPAPPADISDALEHGRLPARRPHREILAGDTAADEITRTFDLPAAQPFPTGAVGKLRVKLPLGLTTLGVQLRVPDDIAAGRKGIIDLVQRDAAGRITGGIAIEITTTD